MPDPWIMAHTLTFPEMMQTDIPVVTRTGEMIGGKDRKYDSDRVKFAAWKKAVGDTFSSPDFREIPQRVMDYFQAVKHLSSPPSTNPPKFSWSFSSLSDFDTCPHQFAQLRYFKAWKQEDNEYNIWGTRVHETAEHYLKQLLGREHDPAKINPDDLPLVKPYCELFAGSGAEVYVEEKITITENLKACEFFAPDAWGRGVVDVGLIKGNKITVYDYKSGKIKDNDLQLKTFLAFAALRWPHLEVFDAKFIWLKHGEITGLKAPLNRADILPVWQDLLARVKRVQEAWISGVFVKKPSGLCNGWCPVRNCPHHKG